MMNGTLQQDGRVQIGSNWYTPKQIDTTSEFFKNDLISRGWDGLSYLMKSIKGKDQLAFRNASTGKFSLVK